MGERVRARVRESERERNTVRASEWVSVGERRNRFGKGILGEYGKAREREVENVFCRYQERDVRAASTRKGRVSEMDRWRRSLFSVFVGNINPSGEIQSFLDVVRRHGRVLDFYFPTVRAIWKRTKSRYGFVRFRNLNEAQSVINALDGSIWLGQKLVASLAKPRNPRQSSPLRPQPPPNPTHQKTPPPPPPIPPPFNPPRGLSYAEVVSLNPLPNDSIQPDAPNLLSKPINHIHTTPDQTQFFTLKEIDLDKDWLDSCAVAEVLDPSAIQGLKFHCWREGVFQFNIVFMGGSMVLLQFDSPDEMLGMLEDGKTWLDGYFAWVKPWSQHDVSQDRFIWLRIESLPLHAWCYSFFYSFGNSWGTFLSIDGDTMNKTRLDRARVMILAKKNIIIPKEQVIMVKDELFTIQVSVEENLDILYVPKVAPAASLGADVLSQATSSDTSERDEAVPSSPHEVMDDVSEQLNSPCMNSPCMNSPFSAPSSPLANDEPLLVQSPRLSLVDINSSWRLEQTNTWEGGVVFNRELDISRDPIIPIQLLEQPTPPFNSTLLGPPLSTKPGLNTLSVSPPFTGPFPLSAHTSPIPSNNISGPLTNGPLSLPIPAINLVPLKSSISSLPSVKSSSPFPSPNLAPSNSIPVLSPSPSKKRLQNGSPKPCLFLPAPIDATPINFFPPSPSPSSPLPIASCSPSPSPPAFHPPNPKPPSLNYIPASDPSNYSRKGKKGGKSKKCKIIDPSSALADSSSPILEIEDFELSNDDIRRRILFNLQEAMNTLKTGTDLGLVPSADEGHIVQILMVLEAKEKAKSGAS